MEQLTALVLDVWRATGRHTELATLASILERLLASWMPLGRLFVCRIEPERACIETVGVGPEPALTPAPAERRDCLPAQIQRLLAWCRRGQVMWRLQHETLDRDLEIVLCPGLAGDLLIGPLVSEPDTYGVVLLHAAPGRHFTALHQHGLGALLEPLAAALENDRQRRQMSALSAAAEADKQSLLRRLGRAEVAETIVGATGRLRPVMERVDLVSRSDVPVLILGETGSGKEVIARAIHTRSGRATGPFIRVNCGAIAPDLIDSELFGHEKGSFTGAVHTRRGWFERADEGSLFLDEIGELPLAAQVRLLRVLQEGVFERVGGERPLKVDVRIVAATHRDLAIMVQQGRFREDLWYRVAVFPIMLPPLRDHPEDIAALAEHFARRAAVRFGMPLQLPSPQDIALLAAYPWPGNVRELGTVIDRAAILGAGRGLEVATALGGIPGSGVHPLRQETDQDATGISPRSARLLSLDAVIKQHIEAALLATSGRVDGPHGAARLLRVNPHTLRGKMRKLGIAWRQFRSGGSPG